MMYIALLALVAVASPPPHAEVEEEIRGRIVRIEGKYTFTVRDERGFLDHVRMHDGTIINPIGLTLAGGMRVHVYGKTRGREFAADEIDTPYQNTRVVPAYAPYGGPYLPAGRGASVIINGGTW